jgi:hypothetical protein
MKSLVTTRIGGIIVALALAMGLSACSAIKLGYNNLPDLAYWWLDGYVDFTDTQAPVARQELARLHAWHRQEELPRLSELLGRLEQLAGGEVSAQQACTVFAEIRTRIGGLAQQAEPGVTALSLTVTARQLRHLERKFRRNNENFTKQWITPTREEQQEKFFDQMVDRAEMIYGRLNEPQKAVLRQSIARSTYDAPRVLAERQRRQQDLLQILRRIPESSLPATEARALLHGWMERAQVSPDAAFRNWQDAVVQEGCRSFADLHQSTTPQQRQQAVRRLQAYQRDVRELAAQSR